MGRHLKRRFRSDPAFGCAPAERDVRAHIRWGAVILDKPAGVTSRRAAEQVRQALGASKVGHGGTLDPKVTGVLPVLLDKATRAAAALLGCDKKYAGVMALHDDVADEELREGLAAFRGLVEQTPPRRSRVRRRPRLRAVHAFEITRRGGRQAEFFVHCESGTYVRKLVHDLGQRLGCGAHMLSLRRTQAGPFKLEDCVSVEEVEAAGRLMAQGECGAVGRVVRPIEEVLARLLPRVRMDDGAVHAVCSGFPLAVPGICELDEFAQGARVAAMTMKGELVGIGRALMSSGDVLRSDRGLAVAVGTVLMDPGTYPRRRDGGSQ